MGGTAPRRDAPSCRGAIFCARISWWNKDCEYNREGRALRGEAVSNNNDAASILFCKHSFYKPIESDAPSSSVAKSRCRCGMERKKLIFFEKSGGKVCIFHIICRIFASLKQNGALVQLVRMPACHAGGRWFESCTHRKRSNEPTKASCFSLF